MVHPSSSIKIFLVLLAGQCVQSTAFVNAGRSWTPALFATTIRTQQRNLLSRRAVQDDTNTQTGSTSPAPVLNGKRVLPAKILLAGIKGNQVAGVYAVYNNNFKRGEEGWDHCEFVGTSLNLVDAIENYIEVNGKDVAAHIRALSFVIPNAAIMEDMADEWKIKVKDAVGPYAVRAAMESSIAYDDDDDDDDDEFDDDDGDFRAEFVNQHVAGEAPADVNETAISDTDIISPFLENESPAPSAEVTEALEFNAENVDKVLDEVRPYLISDGGNVAVDRVDTTTRNVYLILEGACGSCSSSTVTMQMGIERVLKENFPDLGEVLEVEDEELKPSALTDEAVEGEIARLKSAIMAMGGSVELQSIDAENGSVKIFYRGPNKVRQGLELALLDVDFVESVEFVMDPAEAK